MKKRTRKELIDALEDVWCQFAIYRAGDGTYSDGGLSTLELIAEILVQEKRMKEKNGRYTFEGLI